MLIEADNVVIGRGPIGVVTSHALLENSHKVLNLDIGVDAQLSTKDLIVNSNIDYRSATKPPSLVKEGNEHLWGGACMGWRYFDEGKPIGELMPGIPISEKQFLLASKKLKKLLCINNFNFSTDRPTFSRNLKRINGLNLVFAKIINDPYMTKQIRNLHLNPNYNFLPNIKIQQVVDHGTYLECKGELTDSKQPVTINCKRLFLAAGTISNTRILIQSGLDSVNNTFLGKFLSDHISLPIASMTTNNIVEVEKYFGYKKSKNGTKLWPRAKLKQKKDRIYPLDSFCYVTEVNASTKTGQRILALLRRFPILHGFLRMKVEGRFQLNLFAEVSNSSRNEIRVVEANQNLVIDFFLERKDLATILDIANSYIRQISESPLARDGEISVLFDLENKLQLLQGSSHPSGSYRMSSQSAEGVINPVSQLHSHRNIFVLGAGAFPRSAATHPTFTAMVLALIAVNSIPHP